MMARPVAPHPLDADVAVGEILIVSDGAFPRSQIPAPCAAAGLRLRAPDLPQTAIPQDQRLAIDFRAVCGPELLTLTDRNSLFTQAMRGDVAQTVRAADS